MKVALTTSHTGENAVTALVAVRAATTGAFDSSEGTTSNGDGEAGVVPLTRARTSGLEFFRRNVSTTPVVWPAPPSGPLGACDEASSGRRGGPRSHRHHGLESLEGSHEGHSWAM